MPVLTAALLAARCFAPLQVQLYLARLAPDVGAAVRQPLARRQVAWHTRQGYRLICRRHGVPKMILQGSLLVLLCFNS